MKDEKTGPLVVALGSEAEVPPSEITVYFKRSFSLGEATCESLTRTGSKEDTNSNG